ncbi:hypothetical protein [Microbacterium sp. PRC9]|uniref:hypothetical protein n=1 Tax=Microbacterium sp. PRC9 TaxID=2962591 RepID=UPI002882916A|nr:hypothetical protein [Microbacterium sp. PRC9]MDT0144243.1 hypothetical protein [Microbacterium sp. PRC9]
MTLVVAASVRGVDAAARRTWRGRGNFQITAAVTDQRKAWDGAIDWYARARLTMAA